MSNYARDDISPHVEDEKHVTSEHAEVEQGKAANNLFISAASATGESRDPP